jgi:DNA polymerase I-like protein with 3'-5' exonuclease and polymerase domains
VMEQAYHIMGVEISVPLEAEAGSGESWAAAH